MKDTSICPIEDSLNFFNRKWILCILMDMFTGLKHFNEFKKSNPELSNSVLSQTLKYMEENNLIKKETKDNKTEYQLTKKALKVNKILYELTIFSLEELEYSKLEEDTKTSILEEYKELLNIR